jgi:hypothetical protein
VNAKLFLEDNSSASSRDEGRGRTGMGTIRIKAGIAQPYGERTFHTRIIIDNQSCFLYGDNIIPIPGACKHAAITADTLFSL